MMIEGWTSLLVLAVLAVLGLGSLADRCFEQARKIRAQREQRRLLLRDNLNILIMTMTHEEDDTSLEQLHQAFATSLGEYRSLG